MPRSPADYLSPFKTPYNRIRLAPDWDQCDLQSKATRLKDAFRADVLPIIWDAFEARDDAWWQSAVYALGLTPADNG